MLVTDGRPRCPHCAGDLSVYFDLKQRAVALAAVARQQLSRGETQAARSAIEHLAKLAAPAEVDMAPLRARLALLEGEAEQAAEYAAHCEPAEREELQRQAALLSDSRRRARELYNYALTCARRGALRDAAGFLTTAVGLDPDDPALWELKLKTDLKLQRFNDCYRDLAALDRLAARPPAFYQLEQLLPALPAS